MTLFKYNKKDLKLYPLSFIKIYYPAIVIISILFILNLFTWNRFYNEKSKNQTIKEDYYNLQDENNELLGVVELLNETNEFSEENLYLVLEGLNIMYPHIVIAQSKIETNNWKHSIFKESGNLFGMKAAKLRPHTHFGEHKGHADYKGNWKLSVIDYALWQSREAKNVKNENQYYFLLSKLYAEDPDYIEKLKKIVEKN
jgi:hypothetical protein